MIKSSGLVNKLLKENLRETHGSSGLVMNTPLNTLTPAWSKIESKTLLFAELVIYSQGLFHMPIKHLNFLFYSYDLADNFCVSLAIFHVYNMSLKQISERETKSKVISKTKESCVWIKYVLSVKDSYKSYKS